MDLLVIRQFAILFDRPCMLDDVAHHVGRSSSLHDLHLAQHLPDDDLDVLVVDLHALQTVDVLDLLHDMLGHGFQSAQPQHVVGVEFPVDQHLSARHPSPFEDGHVAGARDVHLLHRSVVGRDVQTLLVAHLGAVADHALDLGKYRVDLCLGPRLEQVDHARQPSGDVAGLGPGRQRNPGQHVALLHRGAFGQADHGVGGQGVMHRLFRSFEQDRFAGLVDQIDGRGQRAPGWRSILGVQHANAGQTRHLVGGHAHRLTICEVDQAKVAFPVCQQRLDVRIPAGQHLSGSHGLAFLYLEEGSVRHLVDLLLAAVVVRYDQLAGTRGHHPNLLPARQGLQLPELDLAVVADGDIADGRDGAADRATDMERPHGELRAGLTDRLRGDHADGFTPGHQDAARQVPPITFRTDAAQGLAGHRGPNLDLAKAPVVDLGNPFLVQQRAGRDQDLLAVVATCRVFRGHAPEHSFRQGLHDVRAFDDGPDDQPVLGSAIIFHHHEILRDVDQPPGQVAGIGGLQRGVGQPLAGAVGRDEVLQDIQPFAEVGRDRGLDDGAVRLGHQAAHPRQLADLGLGAPRAGVRHHVDRIERWLLHPVALAIHHFLVLQTFHHLRRHIIVRLRPAVDHLVAALVIGQQAAGVLLLDFLYRVAGALQNTLLLFRHHHVVDAEGNTGDGGIFKAGVHQAVAEDHRVLQAQASVASINDVGDGALVHVPVDQLERQAFGQDVRQQGPPHRGLDPRQTAVRLRQPDRDARMKCRLARVVGPFHLVHVRQHHAFAGDVDAGPRHVVQAQHDVLGRHDDRFAAGGRQHVVGRHHQRPRFQLRLHRQRHVYRHLVAVEVGVERGTDQGVQLDRLALDQDRLERLDAEPVQGRRTVQHDRMLADHLAQDVPDLRPLALHLFACRLDRGGQSTPLQLAEDERLEQFQRHLLGQAALVQLQRGPDHDHGAPGIVHTLAEQVLAEPSLLAFDDLGQRFKTAFVVAGHHAPAPPVVEQRVHRLLQHPLLIADDDIRGTQFQQPTQPVIAVDHAPVQVIQVGGGETPALQRHQRAQVRRQHRQHGQYHPLRLVARVEERLVQLQALGQPLDLGLAAGLLEFLSDPFRLLAQVQVLQQRLHCLRAHHRLEVLPEAGAPFLIFRLGQKLPHLQVGVQPRIGDHIALKSQDLLQVRQGHVQHQTDPGRQGFEEPDVHDRAGQLDVAHAPAAFLGPGDLDSAFLAHDPAVLQPLVLAAQAFVILDRAEDACAAQAVALRPERPVVDGLRLLDFSVGPGADRLRGGQADPDRVEVGRVVEGPQQCKRFSHDVLRSGLPYRGSGGNGSTVRSRSISMLMPSARTSRSRTLNDSGSEA